MHNIVSQLDRADLSILTEATDVRRTAAWILLEQGLTVVPYVPPRIPIPKAGKRPLWRSYPDGAESQEDRRRVEIEPGDVNRLEWALSVAPDLNVAVLGVCQVDADDADSILLVKDLRVRFDRSCWGIRTRRGCRFIYKIPHRTDVTHGTKVGGQELDLLTNAPAILPPSVHPSGHPYAWYAGHTPESVPASELSEPPNALLDWWAKHSVPKRPPPSRRPVQQPGDFIQSVINALSEHPRRPARQKGNGWYEPFHCPFTERHGRGDADPSFAVNVDSAAYKCWSCDSHGSFRDLAKRLNIPVSEIRRTRRGVVVKGAL